MPRPRDELAAAKPSIFPAIPLLGWGAPRSTTVEIDQDSFSLYAAEVRWWGVAVVVIGGVAAALIVTRFGAGPPGPSSVPWHWVAIMLRR